MLYLDQYLALASAADTAGPAVFDQLGATIRSFDFVSSARNVLPGAASYHCAAHGLDFEPNSGDFGSDGFRSGDDSLRLPDCDVECNSRYRCLLMEATGEAPRGLILLLHGLNEKRWEKYLPWALQLARRTGKAVLLFPIAFHMNRTPAPWSDARSMARVSAERRRAYPSISGSSLANAAISSRLHMLPQRMFWSGLQTYEDILSLLRELRSGQHPYLPQAASVDIFAYSIGAFLSEILLMANEDGMFTSSRLFLFCGGPTLDRMNPTSRYILDSEATIALYSFFNHHLENEFHRDARLAHYFGEGHPAGQAFRSMLSYHTFRAEREQHFATMAGRIRAVALRDDSVIPPGEVLNTLQGNYRDIPIPVDVLHFEHPYSHVTPFPDTEAHSVGIDASFTRVMDIAAEHLSQRSRARQHSELHSPVRD